MKPCSLPVPSTQCRLWTEHPSHSSTNVSLCLPMIGILFNGEEWKHTTSIAAPKTSDRVSHLETRHIFSDSSYCASVLMPDGDFLHWRLFCCVAPEKHLMIVSVITGHWISQWVAPDRNDIATRKRFWWECRSRQVRGLGSHWSQFCLRSVSHRRISQCYHIQMLVLIWEFCKSFLVLSPENIQCCIAQLSLCQTW